MKATLPVAFLLTILFFWNQQAGSLMAQSAEQIALADKLFSQYENEEITGSEIPGCAVMVMRNGNVVYKRAFGMANVTHVVPFGPDTPTNIGSTSKQFTAFAIALLEERGLLSVEDDVRMYIPELPDLGDVVRLKHLISHMSGYREYLNTFVMSGRHLGDFINRDEIIPLIQRQPNLQNKPGDTFNYNNTGYALLAIVVERVTGTDFPSWMKDNIFGPLGMTNTLVRQKPGQIIRGSAMGYVRDEDGNFTEAFDIYASMGAGGIYSTINDLEKWIHNFHQPIVGNPGIAEKIMEPFQLNNGDASAYAYGLIRGEMNGLKMVQHGGADIAHRSNLLMFPEIRGAVVTQSNNSEFPGNIAVRLAEIFFADLMDVDKTAEAGGGVEHAEFVYDAEKFDELAGRYELEIAPGFIIEFTREGDKLYTQATGQPQFELFASSDSTFYLNVVEASMTFHRDKEGKVSHLILHQNGDHRAARIMEPRWEPAKEDLNMYTGSYFSEELEAIYTIAIDEDGKLVLRHRRFPDIPLKAETKDEFNGDMPIQNLKFLRNETDEVTGFEASSGRSFGIVFTKML